MMEEYKFGGRRRSQIRILSVMTVLLCMGSLRPGQGATMSKADYLDPEMTKVNVRIPPYEGKRYDAIVPDTLDLAPRAELAINGMTRVLDAARDYQQYGVADFSVDPPMFIHELGGHVLRHEGSGKPAAHEADDRQ